MKDLEEKVRKITDQVVTREGILPFLRFCIYNGQLSIENLLQAYEQKRDAKYLCGKRAWEQLGRKVLSEVAPIQILYPKISSGKITYVTVNVYDFESTYGADYEETNKKVFFADKIIELTGASWEEVPEVALKDSLKKGYYDQERHVFYISKECTGQALEQPMIELYIDYVFYERFTDEKLIKPAVAFMLFERFHMRHTIINILFGKLSKYTTDEKWLFLNQVLQSYKEIVEEFEGKILSFNEIAYLNHLMNTDDAEALSESIKQAADQIEDVRVEKELLKLKEKILKADEMFLSYLYQKRCERQLFTYPTIYWKFKENGGFYGVEGYFTDD